MNAADDPKALAFLRDLIAVYERHGLSLAHEDHWGAFIVQPLTEQNKKWLLDANLEMKNEV